MDASIVGGLPSPAFTAGHPGVAALTLLFCSPVKLGAGRDVCPHVRRT